MARIDIPRSTAAGDMRATYGPNTAQVELLLDGIAHAQQVDLWRIGLHFMTCMQEIGTVMLRNAVKASGSPRSSTAASGSGSTPDRPLPTRRPPGLPRWGS